MRLASTAYFYQSSKLSTVCECTKARSIMRGIGIPLVEHAPERSEPGDLLSTDGNGSILSDGDFDRRVSRRYTCYGYLHDVKRNSSVLAFNGERMDPQLLWYLLGNGVRVFNPSLMRFHSADESSPFGKGGSNAYMYCNGDPINHIDPSGRFRIRRLPGHVFRPKFPKQVNAIMNLQNHHDQRPSPPSYSSAVANAEMPPSYSDSLKLYPGEMIKHLTVQTPNLDKKLERARDHYSGYIAQQKLKKQLYTAAFTNELRSQTRTSYGSDMWKYYEQRIAKARRSISHYDRKISNLGTEFDRIEAAITQLRTVTA